MRAVLPFSHVSRLDVLVLAVALAPSLAWLRTGFFGDDAWFVHGGGPGPSLPFWDLYRFSPLTTSAVNEAIRHGQLPWWTAESFHLRFLRPLASALLALDGHVFGPRPVAWHLHSLAWWAAFVVGALVLFRRWLAPPTARLAVLVAAWCPGCAETYGWISARHLLVSSAFGVWALVAQDVARASDRAWPRVAYLLAFVLALCGGESGVAALAIAAACAWPSATDPAPRRGWLWPLVLLAVVYVGLHAGLGFGARGSGAYVSPFDDPAGFARVAWLRVPLLLGGAATAGLLGVGGDAGALEALAGLGAWAALLLAVHSTRSTRSHAERALVRRLSAASLGVAFVGAAGPPAPRLLLLLAPSVAPLVGLVLVAAWPKAPHGRPWSWLLAAGTAAAHLAYAPVASVNRASWVRWLGARARDVEVEVASQLDAPARNALVLSAEAEVPFRAAARDGSCVVWLSGAPGETIVRRSGAATEIETPGRTLLDGAWPPLYRAPWNPVRVGATVAQCGATVHVLATRGGEPTRISVETAAVPDATLLAWDGAALRLLSGDREWHVVVR